MSFPRFHSYPADIFQLSAALFLSATAHFITNLFPCPSQSVYHLTAVPCHTVYCFHLLFIWFCSINLAFQFHNWRFLPWVFWSHLVWWGFWFRVLPSFRTIPVSLFFLPVPFWPTQTDPYLFRLPGCVLPVSVFSCR